MSGIRSLTVSLGQRSYPIHIGPGALAAHLPAAASGYRQAFVISNEIVAPLYLEATRAALGDREIHTYILPDGEQTKSPEHLWGILDAMIAARIERGAAIVALGGGVVGDIAGFAAAIFQRGIDFIQVPTTLLSQVDSSVGGKTAINHPKAKNMIGAFHQPVAVIADTDTLDTLPDREYRAGLAEVVKYGIIGDLEFFDWLEAHVAALNARDPETLKQAIERSCANKARVVAADEREAGERALLNLGHTFGHAFEALLGYGVWLHGEAVAAGMVTAAACSVALGTLDAPARDRIETLIEALGLPCRIPASLSANEIWQAMLSDKKMQGGRPKLILVRELGRAEIVGDYDIDTILNEVDALRVDHAPAELVA